MVGAGRAGRGEVQLALGEAELTSVKRTDAFWFLAYAFFWEVA